MEDSEIIRLFFERSEDSIYELSRKYGRVCMKLSMNILADRQDAEECVNDSYLVAWDTIPPRRPNPLIAYICRIVRNVSIKRYRYNTAKKRRGEFDVCLDELQDCLPSPGSAEESLSEAELASYIDDFLNDQSRTDRMLFVRRFFFLDSYEELSRISGLKEGAIRTRLSRIKASLRSYLAERGIEP